MLFVVLGLVQENRETWRNNLQESTKPVPFEAMSRGVSANLCQKSGNTKDPSWKTCLCNLMLAEAVAIVWGILAQLNGQCVENIYFPNHTKRMTHIHAQAVLLIDGLGRLCSCRYTSRSNSWSLQGMQSKWSWLR